MKLVRYLHGGREFCGIANADYVRSIDWTLRDALVLAAAGRDDLCEYGAGAPLKLAEVDLLAPITPTSRIFCAGINYHEHQRESADVFVASTPKEPIVFLKTAAAIAAPNADLPLSATVSQRFDWEAELGVVIGAPARAVDSDRAWDVVAGYTVVNDISARDLQTAHVQWFLGKNVAQATPVGPWIASVSEVGTDPDLEIRLLVDGVLKQEGRSSEMIFDIPRLISTISRVTPLLPGDVIATGTPSGVGFKRTPPEYLKSSQVIEVTVERVGTIRNMVVTEDQLPVPGQPNSKRIEDRPVHLAHRRNAASST
jgi:acylpyruvate hydrolase